MIKRLRIRFITTTMLAVFIVLGSIMAAINVINYSNIRSYADNILSMLIENDGGFGGYFSPSEGKMPLPEIPFQKWAGKHQIPEFMNMETPYETRYFSVKYGEVTTADVGHIAAISEKEALELADKVMNGKKSNGYSGNYRYLINESRDMVVFMDCTRQLETADNFLAASIFASLGGALCVFLLAFAFSYRAIAPIAESYEKQKRFITDAGHELKTPLTIISANNELIELTQGESESTRAISKQVSRMSSMVQSLSTLAKIDEESRLAQRKEMNLSVLCEEACELFAPVFDSSERSFDYNIEKSIRYKGDEELISRLISIVLENAGKYSLSFATLSLVLKDKRVIITAQNDASFVEDGELTRCFERFYRSDDARASDVEGSGIGLCVAKEIVELHGGSISAHGSDGKIFTLKIIL